MIHLKASNRFVGVNTDNPFHALSLLIATNAVFTLPYDGLSVMTPNNPANAASGLVVGSDPSDYVNKGYGTLMTERSFLAPITWKEGNHHQHRRCKVMGIAAPSEKLHVIGNILASSFIIASDLRYKKISRRSIPLYQN
ncbi:MAG: hypothetical protein IPG38_11540 [Chitinophagaceae bacterium]|nr:hypothetical protein [Chitinophagaceae bacterium]